MSEITNIANVPQTLKAKMYSALFAILYLCFSFGMIFGVTGDYSFSGVFSVLTAGVTGKFAIMFCFFAFLISFGSTGNHGVPLVILPTLFAVIMGVIFSDAESLLYSLFEFLPASITAYATYYLYVKKENRATVCAFGAFVMTVAELLNIFFSVLSVATANNISFSTVLFQNIDNFISTFVNYYEEALSAYSSAGTNLGMSFSAAIFRLQLIRIIGVMPALMVFFNFFFVFLFTYAADFFNRRTAFIKDLKFGKYAISAVTNIIFSVFLAITLISTFFEYGFTAFFGGILCVVLAIMPHYIILGYRKLYLRLKKHCGKAFSVVILIVVSCIAFYTATTLSLCIIIWLGSSEYRNSKRAAQNDGI